MVTLVNTGGRKHCEKLISHIDSRQTLFPGRAIARDIIEKIATLRVYYVVSRDSAQ